MATQFTWADPTTSVDGSPLVPGEVTGYTIGVRSTTAAGSAAGTYSALTSIIDPAATSEAISALSTVLKPDSYAAAIRSDGLVVSAWSTETMFAIAAPPLPVPNPPSNFSAV
jgi:hypothetical protein